MASAPYLDPSQPIEARISDLLPRMKLAEKCAQLVGPFGLDESDGKFSLDFVRQHFKDGISYINTHHRLRQTRQTVAYLNAMQKFLRDETRLGIPALGIGEGLHGYMAHDATSFPQAIGLASAWDPGLHRRVFEVGGARDAGTRCALCSLAGAGHCPRSALGTDRGNVWRGPVSCIAFGCGSSARPAG